MLAQEASSGKRVQRRSSGSTAAHDSLSRRNGGSCLDDASAFLARLGIQSPPALEADQAAEPAAPLLQWLERWRSAGGTRDTLRLMVRTLMAHRG